ncbi:MAG: isochorismate synthase [Cyanobacteria bacterium SID2]|nr:isochorismate synthase [Cyanobacteria bacterium SID2]MBP0004959.1 isochorismate synthase [Cyanobacteria bacterium SBC]
MNTLAKPFKAAAQYVSEAFLRIFGPTDDSYPKTGVQPFEGSPNK